MEPAGRCRPGHGPAGRFGPNRRNRFGVDLAFDPATLRPFPLAAAHVRAYVGQASIQGGIGFALLGDAAHRIHPLAGMGLNLGISDVGACLDTLVQARRLGTDLATLPALRPYERARRAENESLIFATDALSRLFGASQGLRGYWAV